MARFLIRLIRNSPSPMLVFSVRFALSFEATLFGATIRIPNRMKDMLGLSLLIMANIAEVMRGAVQSVSTVRWEAAESPPFDRCQIPWQIILPQCYGRMLPPWMNRYTIPTMATLTKRGKLRTISYLNQKVPTFAVISNQCLTRWGSNFSVTTPTKKKVAGRVAALSDDKQKFIALSKY